MDPREVDALLAERAIHDVVLRYCRGIDRRQFDLVRDCYHPDAIDEHGDFTGTVDAFIEHATRSLLAFESTTHLTGNVLVELDPENVRRARCETYAIAIHRLAARDARPARDHVIGLRYVDGFEQRDGRWRIATRICVFDWTRTDPVTGWQFSDAFRRGCPGGDDIVFAPSLREQIDQPGARP
jgi:hypothetical protein